MFGIGDRVRITNPKSIAHLEAGGMRPIGTVVKIEKVEKMVKVEWKKPREDRGFFGYFVILDDNPLDTLGIPYRATELAKL
jgi:hypothetical protein